LKYGFSADSICDGTDTYSSGFVAGSDFTINTETYNGNYICVIAQDLAGNTSYAVASNPLNIDATPPVITILGDNPQNILVNSAFVDSGAIRTDNVDGS